jgi:hypothetical protein
MAVINAGAGTEKSVLMAMQKAKQPLGPTSQA